MLGAVGTTWIKVLVGFIATVVLASVVIGLASPDGTVGGKDGATTAPSAEATTPTASPTPAPTTTSKPVSAARAPASVRGTWPGRPSRVKVRGSRVDWCPAVRTKGAAEANAVFGKAAVRKAACTAVQFVFEQRYSRLALPRRSYAAKDFDPVVRTLAPLTADAYRARVNAFVSWPSDRQAEALGLVLFRGAGTAKGASQVRAGKDRVFYGPAFSTQGYRGRAVWINPTWSRVSIRVDRTKAVPRIVATVRASASLPVFNRQARRHDMLTAPTRATFYLRRSGTSWRIGGWDRIANGPYSYGPLDIR